MFILQGLLLSSTRNKSIAGIHFSRLASSTAQCIHAAIHPLHIISLNYESVFVNYLACNDFKFENCIFFFMAVTSPPRLFSNALVID